MVPIAAYRAAYVDLLMALPSQARYPPGTAESPRPMIVPVGIVSTDDSRTRILLSWSMKFVLTRERIVVVSGFPAFIRAFVISL